jgi:ribonuclease HII
MGSADMNALLEHDRQATMGWPPGSVLVGVDEAGRGCLAGPVVAAALAVRVDFLHQVDTTAPASLQQINDSKQLNSKERSDLAASLRGLPEQHVQLAVASASVAEIAEHNILGATTLAMQRALGRLPQQRWLRQRSTASSPDKEPSQLSLLEPLTATTQPIAQIWVDGRPVKGLRWPHLGLIKGDGLSWVIAAASVLAKVSRDEAVSRLDQSFPGYQFARHKGYGTQVHVQALRALGPCPAHRARFLRNLGMEQRCPKPL